MDWSGNLRVPLVSRPENSCSYLFNYNYDHFPGLEMKQPLMVQEHEMLPTLMLDKNNMNYNTSNHYRHNDLKKKRLSNEQLESLEKGFQEDIKLEPDRKMKLANELGLRPRQIAVWFQNRRARWKGKQLERLYDALKHEYAVVSMEKNKLQQEVLALRAVTREQVTRGNAELFDSQEAAESWSIANSGNPLGDTSRQIPGPNNYAPNTDDYSSVVEPPIYWPTFSS